MALSKIPPPPPSLTPYIWPFLNTIYTDYMISHMKVRVYACYSKICVWILSQMAICFLDRWILSVYRVERFQSDGPHQRPSPIVSLPRPVTYGAMGLCCGRSCLTEKGLIGRCPIRTWVERLSAKQSNVFPAKIDQCGICSMFDLISRVFQRKKKNTA